MAELMFPLSIERGDFILSENIASQTQSRILLYLTTKRGEMLWNIKRGIPFYLFESVKNISRDLAAIEIDLKSAMPEIDFRVTGELQEDGLVTVSIDWKYTDIANNITFEAEIGA